MQLQLTRKGIANIALVGAIAMTVSVLQSQPASAQLNRSNFREVASELNLSRSQMREVGGIMRNFNTELQDILTEEQYELLQASRESQASGSEAQDPQALRDSLNLTDTQSEQLATARGSMMTELQAVLTPEQIAGMMEMAGFDQL